VQFGITDHIDVSGIPPVDQLEERLRLVELYDRLGFDRYMLTEHHGTARRRGGSPQRLTPASTTR
jgi:alkanesulfonate monooxygenase SsuD/methylene tetrahydromethanopterin reductase-like flavin-dependent oxidoreductase (luciferase family)